jgi:hypothetical protein
MPKRKVTKEKGTTKKPFLPASFRVSRTFPEGPHFSWTSTAVIVLAKRHCSNTILEKEIFRGKNSQDIELSEATSHK